MDQRRMAAGLIVEHWDDRDVLPDGTKVSRYWKQSGAARITLPRATYSAILAKAWKWDITLIARMADGTLYQSEISTATPVHLQDLDDLLYDARTALLLEHPGYVAFGFRAAIKTR